MPVHHVPRSAHRVHDEPADLEQVGPEFFGAVGEMSCRRHLTDHVPNTSSAPGAAAFEVEESAIGVEEVGRESAKDGIRKVAGKGRAGAVPRGEVGCCGQPINK